MFGIWPNRSDFVKECPACGQLVAVRDLRKTPREVKARWYQFTPSPHTACPHCGQRVVFTFVNSPLVVVPFLLVGSLIFGALLVPQIRDAFAAMPWLKFGAELVALVVSGVVITVAVKRARLTKEV